MRKKTIGLLLLMLLLLTMTCCAEQTYQDVYGYSYIGKWIVFGPDNDYMFYCPAAYFDNSMYDVYGADATTEPDEIVYFTARPDYFFHHIKIGNKETFGYDCATAEELMKKLEEGEYSVSRFEQYGLDIIQGTGGADEESPEGKPEWFNITLDFVMDGDDVLFAVYHQFLTLIETKEDMLTLDAQVMSSIQPVNGSVPEIGQYSVDSIIIGEETYDMKGEDAPMLVITLTEDGHGFMYTGDDNFPLADWTVENGTITLDFGEGECYKGSMEGDTMLLDQEALIYVMKKTQDAIIMPVPDVEE